MRTILLAAAVLLTAAPVAAGAQGEDRQKIDTTFAFEKNGVVDLGHVSGDIVVTGWTKTEVKIFATIETGYLESSLSSSRVRINARSRFGRMGHSRYELSVPIGTEVRASTVSGNVAVRGVAGEVTAKSVSGDVELKDIDGEVTGKSVSGSLEASGALGNLEFESVSGDVTFVGDLKANASFRANTHSGDVQLTLPATLNANVEVQTFSGDFRTDFPITVQPGANTRGRRMSGTIGSGGGRISLETFSGDVHLRKGAARTTREN